MNGHPLILIVEDDDILGSSLRRHLELEGYQASWTRTAADALSAIARQAPDAILCDIRLPDGDGETLMREVFERLGAVPTIFMTAHGSIDQAVRLVRMGARDYVSKPFDLDEVVAKLTATTPTDRRAEDGEFATFGLSAPTAEIRQMLEKVRDIDLPVLILGETGTGKEIAARLLHSLGARRDEPFLAVNCAALAAELVDSTLFGHEKGAFTGAHERKPGLAELAGEGTFFLDEIGELDAALQAKLLRLIQEREFSRVGGRTALPFRARLVCATHRDLEAEVARGTFRQDLWFRINVLTLRMPALRDRPEEIGILLSRFVNDAASRLHGNSLELDDSILPAARAYDWPGNVRELKNRVERAVALAEGSRLSAADIFPESGKTGPLSTDGPQLSIPQAAGSTLAEVRDATEKAHIESTLKSTGYNIQATAIDLGISRTTLWEKMRRLGIDKEG